ncbi:hypothetical protein SAMN05444671_2697 [Flavobacterium sp. CF108]|uniref:Uncharacterized protein n=1 Tax=Flavobacterium panici TaxID=2654843 RepID=A0A9N8P2P7_9FLAO|nr:MULTISPECIES: hypothetical protein [Flavobacterium]UUF13972.1 hypothetical protein NLJ00_22220 [Flavobacterium panici]CAC9975273.1 hypothetical protein FLAPXU55_02982 [Flavobacterium panici]SEN99434.1 hypothetical protein SAMN04487978_2012 [Flavobacterium sp. fv08]SHH34392.1 hypothetical protein SAMN05444671_2697 [Flavobacterium sp. CF108]
MQTVNPLTMYVPIYQTDEAQATAQTAYENFNNPITKASLDKMAIVHYARIALVPNTDGKGIAGILIITEFDGNMNSYLEAFFNNSTTIRAAFILVITLWANKPADFPTNPDDITYTIFSNFINERNLSQSQDLYYAYPQSVKQIVAKFSK